MREGKRSQERGTRPHIDLSIAKKLGQGDAIGEIRDEHLGDMDKGLILNIDGKLTRGIAPCNNLGTAGYFTLYADFGDKETCFSPVRNSPPLLSLPPPELLPVLCIIFYENLRFFLLF